MSNDPINKKRPGCATTTSNCVVWQGPDLCCINVCKGDTISLVMKKVADKLCTVLQLMDPKKYDVSCITDSPCGLETFPDLINMLIAQICQLRNLDPQSNPNINANPDIAVATCFQSQYGNVMSLLDYVSAIGVKLCAQQVQIETLITGLQQANVKITQLENQVALPNGG